MSQLFIVTTPQNSGLGTPLATAFNYTNSNFSQLFARFQTSVPTSLLGQPGDVAGMYAADSTYFYYCFADYDGTSTIWAQVTQVGNISVARILNGTSNVDIAAPGSNVTVSVGATANVAVFNSFGVDVAGDVSATGNVTGAYILGDGSQLTGLPATYTDANVTSLLSNFGSNVISTTGNVTASYVIASGAYLASIPAANVTGTVANAAYATAAGTADTVTDSAQPNITSVGTLTSLSVSGSADVGNVNTTGIISATGNIVTAGFFVGNFTGNIVATLTNIPGPGGAVVFNDGTGNAAATAGLVFDNSGPNVLSVLGSYSATANVSANVVIANLISGTLTTASQPNVTSVGTLSSLTSAGNVTAGNLVTSGVLNATNITGGAVSVTGNITGGNFISANTIINSDISTTGNVTASNYFGTIATASQTNITAVGTLTTLSVSGSVQGGNLRTAGVVSATGNITAAGNIRGGNLTVVTDAAVGGNLSAGLFTGASVSVTGNVTGGNVLTVGAVSATGNVSGAFFLGNGSQLTGITSYNDANVVNLLANFGSNNISTTGNITANAVSANTLSGVSVSLSGNVSALNFIGFVATPSQPQITTVGTLTFLSVTGNTNISNLAATTMSASGNVTGASLVGTIATAAQPAITSVGTLGSLSVTGNITGGNVSVGTGTVTLGGIVNANGNATGNIGSESGYFNTVFAKATSAQYADLAENYEADSDYGIGTVLVFGGNKEVTVTNQHGDERVAGVVSENPAHLMNAGQPGLPIALRGRVKVRVAGPVVKGDSLVTSTMVGVAVSVGRDRSYGQAVFAKALETDIEDGEKIITAVIL